jgi:hypothetical protein
MDASQPGPGLYEPGAGRALVLAHRPAGGGAARNVVSDAVWSDVLVVLRWARATLRCRPELLPGVAWRTAAAAAALLRRLPALGDELGECWRLEAAAPTAGGTERERLQAAAERLESRLRTPAEALPLCRLAVETDAVGAAAVGLVAAGADWGLR